MEGSASSQSSPEAFRDAEREALVGVGGAAGSQPGLYGKQIGPVRFWGVQLALVLALLLVVLWYGKYDTGFSWQEKRTFNWHPVFMTLAFVVFYSEAVISFRAWEHLDRQARKVLHMAFHGAALAFSVVGLYAVFRFHNESGIENLYSLHSWLGISTVVAYWGQFATGFVSFWYPGFSERVRKRFVRSHGNFGILVLSFLISCTVVTGVLEKLTFQKECNDPSRDTPTTKCYIANFYGLTILGIFVTLSWMVMAR